jgi:hypothetical protein
MHNHVWYINKLSIDLQWHTQVPPPSTTIRMHTCMVVVDKWTMGGISGHKSRN